MSDPTHSTADPWRLTAVLLCGGKGERLRPFTEHMPKPLVPLGGRPILEHLMRFLAHGGLRDFVLCAGYKAEAIEAFLAEERIANVSTRCVDSGEASMADRILDARRFVEGAMLVCYGDTLANVDVAALLRDHQGSGALATVTVYPLRSPFGVVAVDPNSGKVTGLLEKPVLPHWINIGFVVCEPAALDAMERGEDLVAFLSRLAARGQLHAHRHTGKHLTVNTEKERREAEDEVEFFSLQEGMGL